MSDNFSAIKKKYFIAAIIAGAALGACCGIIISCLLAVVFKTNAIDFHWALYIPIALVTAGGFGALFFLLLRPTDDKVAKKLDGDFALSQKVQTMVEFREAEGEMVRLQREQADEALSEAAVTRIDLRFLLKFLLIPVLAVALFIAGIVVPAKKSTVPEEPPFNITDSQKTALINLINDVNASSLKTNLKAPTVEVLNGLLEGLEDEQPTSVMRRAVISSVRIIDGFFATVNTYGKLGVAFAEQEELTGLGYALLDSVTFYIEPGKTITTLGQVTSKEADSDASIEKLLANFAAEFLKDYATGKDEDLTPIPIASASEKLSAYASLVTAKLEASGLAPGEGETAEELYSVLSGFANSLNVLAASTSGMSNSAYYETVSGLIYGFASVEGDVVPVLAMQSYNCMMDEFIRNRLAEIFRLSAGDFGESEAVVTRPNAGGDSDEESNSGGYGKDGIKTAGDDLVLDTELDDGTQIKYGEVINKYEQFFNEMVEGGSCSAELEAYIRRYFDILYNGIKEENEQ